VVTKESHQSLIGAEGWTVVVPLLIPVVVALLPVLLRHRPSAQRARVWAAVLLGIGVALAMASVGMFYLPALGMLVAAAAVGSKTSDLGADVLVYESLRAQKG